MISVCVELPWWHVFDYLAAHGVTFVKYASVLLQSLTIMLDEDFLMEIIDMTKIKGAWSSMDEE
jgi:vacuolar protein sorting-associated protein 13A/C